MPDFKFNKIYYDTRFDGVDEIPEYRENDNFHTGRILGVTALTDDDLARLGLKMLAGRLPKDKMEVVFQRIFATFILNTDCTIGRKIYKNQLFHIVPLLAKRMDNITK